MKTRIAIIRVAREYIDIIWSSLLFISLIQGRKIKLRVLHCSGTIKKIEMKAKGLLINWINQVLKSSELTMQIRVQLLEQSEKDIIELEKIE